MTREFHSEFHSWTILGEGKAMQLLDLKWSRQGDSDPRPTDYKSVEFLRNSAPSSPIILRGNGCYCLKASKSWRGISHMEYTAIHGGTMFLNRYKEGGLRLLAQDYTGSDSEEAFAEFQKMLEGYEILLASSSKSGSVLDTFVLARRDGKLYSQQDYCCDHGKGLGGWWRIPAEIHHPDSAEAILRRMEASGLGEGNSHAGNEFREELRQVLAEHLAL